MKVESALVKYIHEGMEITLEHFNIEMKELAHALIELAQPQLEIAIPESQIEKFRNEAKRDYMGSTKIFTDFDAYQELYVRLKIGEYERLEHAKQAYNEAVIAYEEKIKSLKQQ